MITDMLLRACLHSAMGIASIARRCMTIIDGVHVGNAPTLLSLKQLQKTASTWMNTSMDIFNDPEANQVRPFPD